MLVVFAVPSHTHYSYTKLHTKHITDVRSVTCRQWCKPFPADALCTLQDREQEILTLRAQLSEFQQPVAAMAGGGAAGITTLDPETGAAAEPMRALASSQASWVNDWNTAAYQSRDSNMARPQATPEAGVALQPTEVALSRYAVRQIRRLSLISDTTLCGL